MRLRAAIGAPVREHRGVVSAAPGRWLRDIERARDEYAKHHPKRELWLFRPCGGYKGCLVVRHARWGKVASFYWQSMERGSINLVQRWFPAHLLSTKFRPALCRLQECWPEGFAA